MTTSRGLRWSTMSLNIHARVWRSLLNFLASLVSKPKHCHKNPNSIPKMSSSVSTGPKPSSAGTVVHVQCCFPTCSKIVEANKTKCRAHRHRKVCGIASCKNQVYARGFCVRHGGKIRCTAPACTRYATCADTKVCVLHGGQGIKRLCKVDGCTTQAHGKQRCVKHGGGHQCKVNGCIRHAKVGGTCAPCRSATKCRNILCHNPVYYKHQFCYGHMIERRSCGLEYSKHEARVVVSLRPHWTLPPSSDFQASSEAILAEMPHALTASNLSLHDDSNIVTHFNGSSDSDILPEKSLDSDISSTMNSAILPFLESSLDYSNASSDVEDMDEHLKLTADILPHINAGKHEEQALLSRPLPPPKGLFRMYQPHMHHSGHQTTSFDGSSQPSFHSHTQSNEDNHYYPRI